MVVMRPAAPGLREQLQLITDTHVGDAVDQQIAAISELAAQYPHPIVLEGRADPRREESWRYNCYMYAFGLVPVPAPVQAIAAHHRSVFPNSDFATFLVHGHLKSVDAAAARDGDIVLYLSDGRPSHAGKIVAADLISKWGTAHLWRHALFEVPIRYGSDVRFFRSVGVAEATAMFLEYAAEALGEDAVRKTVELGA